MPSPVFLILVHRDPAMFSRLAARLDPFRLIVHVDAKADQQSFLAALSATARSRTTFIDERVAVNWAAYTQTDGIRRLVRAGVASSAPDDYLILLSGQDYPLKSMPVLSAFLNEHSGSQFMRFFAIADATDKYRTQVDHRHFRDLPILTTHGHQALPRRVRNGAISLLDVGARRLGKRRPPTGLVLAHGSSHFAITASLAEELESSVTPDIERFFRGVFASDEKFYPSLAASMPAPPEGLAGKEAFVGEGNWRYRNLHHIHPSLAKIYTHSDWDEVSASDRFFLRKLESGVSDALLDRIDTELLARQ